MYRPGDELTDAGGRRRKVVGCGDRWTTRQPSHPKKRRWARIRQRTREEKEPRKESAWRLPKKQSSSQADGANKPRFGCFDREVMAKSSDVQAKREAKRLADKSHECRGENTSLLPAPTYVAFQTQMSDAKSPKLARHTATAVPLAGWKHANFMVFVSTLLHKEERARRLGIYS